MTKYMHWFKRTIATIMSIDRQQSETIDGREDPDFWQMIKFKRQMKIKQDLNQYLLKSGFQLSNWITVLIFYVHSQSMPGPKKKK